jgi:hypothetical protein
LSDIETLLFHSQQDIAIPLDQIYSVSALRIMHAIGETSLFFGLQVDGGQKDLVSFVQIQGLQYAACPQISYVIFKPQSEK